MQTKVECYPNTAFFMVSQTSGGGGGGGGEKERGKGEGGKKKILVTSIFSFFHSVCKGLFPQGKSAILSNSFQFGPV